MNDWMDEVLDGKAEEAEMWQLGHIENLLHRTGIPSREQENIMNSLNRLTKIEAEEIIIKIKENEIETDPRKQYEQMRRNGMFSS